MCVRLGNHTKEVFDNLALKIVEAWNAIVNAGEQPKDQSRQLRTVCVVAEIVAAVEANFVLPEVSWNSVEFVVAKE